MSSSTQTTALTCEACGAPLAASSSVAHVACTYCNATNVIATENAMRVAKVLDRHGIRMPERPMSLSQIHEVLAERRAAEEAKRRTSVIATVVILVVVGAGIAALALTGNLAP